MLEPLGDHAERQGLHTGNGLVAVYPVGQYPSQGRHFGQPAAVVLAFKFDGKNHEGYCTIRAGCLTSRRPRR